MQNSKISDQTVLIHRLIKRFTVSWANVLKAEPFPLIWLLYKVPFSDSYKKETFFSAGLTESVMPADTNRIQTHKLVHHNHSTTTHFCVFLDNCEQRIF